MFLPVETVLWEAEFADRDAQLDFGVFCQRFYFDFEIEESFRSGRSPRRLSLRKYPEALWPDRAALRGFSIYCKTPTLVLPPDAEDLELLSETDCELRSAEEGSDVLDQLRASGNASVAVTTFHQA